MAKKTDDELIADCEARLKQLRKRKADAIRREQTRRAKGIAEQADSMTLQQLIDAANARGCDARVPVGTLLSRLYDAAKTEERAAAKAAAARAEGGSEVA